MDPLLTAAAFSTTAVTCEFLRRTESEDAFYQRHGGRTLRRSLPAVPAVAITLLIAVIVVTGVLEV